MENIMNGKFFTMYICHMCSRVLCRNFPSQRNREEHKLLFFLEKNIIYGRKLEIEFSCFSNFPLLIVFYLLFKFNFMENSGSLSMYQVTQFLLFFKTMVTHLITKYRLVPLDCFSFSLNSYAPQAINK